MIEEEWVDSGIDEIGVKYLTVACTSESRQATLVWSLAERVLDLWHPSAIPVRCDDPFVWDASGDGDLEVIAEVGGGVRVPAVIVPGHLTGVELVGVVHDIEDEDARWFAEQINAAERVLRDMLVETIAALIRVDALQGATNETLAVHVPHLAGSDMRPGVAADRQGLWAWCWSPDGDGRLVCDEVT